MMKVQENMNFIQIHFLSIPDDLPKLIKTAIGNPTPDKVHHILNSYKDPDHALLGCFIDKQLIGVIGFQIVAGTGIIKHIAVEEAHQKQGIGKALITEVLNEFIINSLEAETDEDSVDFYRNCDFIITPFEGPYGKRFKATIDRL